MPHRRLAFVFFVLPFCLAALCVGAENPVPGQNINMVSGTTFPAGDPFLQRQNEPSMAVSTRNPLHLLAGANDYRSVDLLVSDSLPNFDQMTGDAWLGIFKSFDGGQTWRSTLHPGFPQDISSIGVASPLKGLKAASDPVVRSAAGGLFAYGGIAFNRDQNKGVVFISRFLDMNNKENGDPIRFVDTKVLATGNAGQFLDKEWVASYSPGSGTPCTVDTQTIPLSYLYLVYTVFVGNTDQVVRTKLYFMRSTDCGNTWGNATKLSEGVPINQGAQIGVDPNNGAVYVVWRQFASNNQPDAINIVKSTDFGQTFTKPQTIRTLPPYVVGTAPSTAASFFDQGSTGGSIRTNAFPSIAVGDNNMVYVAWAQRGVGNHPDSARVVLTSSLGGVTWTPPAVVDDDPIADPANPDSLYANFDPGSLSYDRGHQFMPALSISQGKLMLLYYDQRLDHTLAEYTPFSPFVPDGKGKFYNERRPQKGGHVGGQLLMDDQLDIFNSFLSDYTWGSLFTNSPKLMKRRHTVEVRLAQIDLATSDRRFATVSQYKFGLRNDADDVSGELQQLQTNPINLPIYKTGQIPFLGDYVDLAAAQTPADTSAPVYATWTTNQNVLPGVNPQTGEVSYKFYTPPGTGAAQSTFDPTQPRPACNPSTHSERSRNQDIYSSRITQGLAVSSPQNVKPFTQDASLPSPHPLQRAFVILVQNFTTADRSFRLTIPVKKQPVNGFASFVQRANPLPNVMPEPELSPNLSVDVTVPAGSGIARPVFAASTSPAVSNPITVNVNEIDHPGGNLVGTGALSSFVLLNSDPTSPQLVNPDGATDNISNTETYTPIIIPNPNPLNPNPLNPNPLNPNPLNVTNPNPLNPNPLNPNPLNPNPLNPNPLNPNPLNPDIADPNPLNPNPLNTDPTNTAVLNPNPLNSNLEDEPNTDATYSVTNNGNTNAGFKVTLANSPGTNSPPLQVIVSKTYTTPQSQNCKLYGQQEAVVLSNFPNATPSSLVGLSDPKSTPDHGTFSLAPGGSALITIRGQNVYCHRTGQGTIHDTGCRDATGNVRFMEDIMNNVIPVVISQAANTNIDTDGQPPTPSFSTPLFITNASTLPDTEARSGETFDGPTYSVTLSAIGGKPPYTWSLASGSLPPGLGLNTEGCPTGVICGIPTAAGDYSFTIQATDSSNLPVSTRKNFTIHVLPVLAITTTALPDVLLGFPYNATLVADGGKPPYKWELVPGNVLPSGLSLDSAKGVISGSETEFGGGVALIKVTDDFGISKTAQLPITEAIVTFQGTANDPAGDSGAGSDLASATVNYWSADVVEVTVQYAPENFNPQTSDAIVSLDTDQNAATGHQGVDAGCLRDNGVLGVEYILGLQSSFAGNQARLSRWTGGCNNFVLQNTLPLQILPAGNGMTVRFPRSLIDPTGALKNKLLIRFKVTSDLFTGPAFSGIMDIMPDVGLAPGQTTQVEPIIE